MAVLQESPWYQEILHEGEQRGIEIGEQRGIEIGEQRGIEIGEQRGVCRVAVNLLKTGLPVEQVAEVTGLALERVQQLQTEANS